ncbi:hypothetical protein OG429_20635 [Streptomyces sp. NBC_00190]|uniref:hypothetical protein n=1 Tax=unclassified Streptomyces TaxID=2593676 RepID=UPI002E2D7B06|nr:hypothetical protein [Streptomyces sp. NBC_00190]WSZ45313.1 hypothetical protein OG239_23415 [Streptomyces sp. NBC_00868]
MLAQEHGTKTATTIALGLYTAYNVAATIASVPAGRFSDRLGTRGPAVVLAGVGIGAVETAEHSAVAALAPKGLRGSAFGMLATVQSLGNLAASTIAGLLWTLVSPTAAFAYLTAWMGVALIGLLWSARRARG